MRDKKPGSDAGGFLNYFQSTRFVYTAYSFKVLLQILEPVSQVCYKKQILICWLHHF